MRNVSKRVGAATQRNDVVQRVVLPHMAFFSANLARPNRGDFGYFVQLLRCPRLLGPDAVACRHRAELVGLRFAEESLARRRV